MESPIPLIVEELYNYFAAPEVQRGYPPNQPQTPHGLWAFYQGLCIGMQLTAACALSWGVAGASSRPTGAFTEQC